MLNYVGVDVESLYEFNNENYLHARNEFIAAASRRLAALQAHTDAVTSIQVNGVNVCIKQLSEMEYKSSSMYRQHRNFMYNLDLYQKILNIPLSLTDDELLAHLIPLLPDLSTRRSVDFKKLKLLDLQYVVEQEFTGQKNDLQDLLAFIRLHRASINFYADNTDSMHAWNTCVKEIYDSVLHIIMQNFFDYIAVLYRLGLKIDNPANEIYIAGLQVAYLMDVYLHIKPINLGEMQEQLEKTIKSKLNDSLDLLKSAPDPNQCAEQKVAVTRCLPLLCYRATTKTEREVKIANEYPSRSKKWATCGLSPW